MSNILTYLGYGGAAIVSAMAILLAKYPNRAIGSDESDIPGPAGSPIIGNFLQFLPNIDRLLDVTLEDYEKYGPVWTVTGPFRSRIVFANDPAILEYIFKKNFENFVKGPVFYDIMYDVLGDGIFNADGEKWRTARKTAAHVFNVNEFKEIINTVFYEEGLIFLDILDKAATTGELVNLNKLFFDYTLDSFGKISFGMDFSCLQNPESPHPFAVAFDYAQMRLQDRFLRFYWRLEEMFTDKGKKMKEAVKILDDFAYNAIRVRREKVQNEGHSEKADILDLFMTKGGQGGDMTDKELRDVFINFIIAGRDTTAQALSWQFFELATQPKIQTKLAAEIKDTLKDKDAPDYDQIRGMKYANAVMLETERLYPSVPKNAKYVVEDDVLPGGYKVKSGYMVTFSPWVMGRLKDIWGPTALTYDPERWYSGVESMKPSPFKYPAFNAGPRLCLGQTFAILEAITLTSMILNKYTFELDDKNFKPKYGKSLTMPMERNPMYRIRRRE